MATSANNRNTCFT